MAGTAYLFHALFRPHEAGKAGLRKTEGSDVATCGDEISPGAVLMDTAGLIVTRGNGFPEVPGPALPAFSGREPSRFRALFPRNQVINDVQRRFKAARVKPCRRWWEAKAAHRTKASLRTAKPAFPVRLPGLVPQVGMAGRNRSFSSGRRERLPPSLPPPPLPDAARRSPPYPQTDFPAALKRAESAFPGAFPASRLGRAAWALIAGARV